MEKLETISNSAAENIPPHDPMWQHQFISIEERKSPEQDSNYSALITNIGNLTAQPWLILVEVENIAQGRNFVGKLLSHYVKEVPFSKINWFNLSSCGWEALNSKPSREDENVVVMSEFTPSRSDMASSINELYVHHTRIVICKPAKIRAYQACYDALGKPDAVFSIKERKIHSRTKA